MRTRIEDSDGDSMKKPRYLVMAEGIVRETERLDEGMTKSQHSRRQGLGRDSMRNCLQRHAPPGHLPDDKTWPCNH